MGGISHGGRLDEAVAAFGGKKEKWLDLSTGLNPNSWKLPEFDPQVWRSLPDQGAEDQCREAARSAYGASEHAHISLAPGSQMHIQLLPYLFKAQPVAIVGFTYQEHGVCWQRAGHEVYVTDGLASAEATARIVIVVNPNNPDGRVHDRAELVNLARRLGAKGGLLVVDEAFADVSPNSSVADEAGRDGLLVLRSLGKFFGLGGVRLGFALTNATLGQRLDEQLGPWSVSGPALEIGSTALSDLKWQKRARNKVQENSEKLEDLFSRMNLKVIGGTALFVLIENANAAAISQHLSQAKILVRPFPGKPDWLRFGVPGSKSALNKLEKALASCEQIA